MLHPLVLFCVMQNSLSFLNPACQCLGPALQELCTALCFLLGLEVLAETLLAVIGGLAAGC